VRLSPSVPALALLVLLPSLAGCLSQVGEEEPVGRIESSLTAAQRRDRAGMIRDAAAARGMTEGWLLAGIADAETTMAHCWSELTWACQGPTHSDCGGPIVAGAGDGPCSIRQGGLGMFQFDAGTYDQTIAREGARVLSISGNTDAAVDFVIAMVIRSTFISGVDNASQALDWMNGVRPDNGRMDQWAQTVTRYYNGCSPTSSCWSSRLPRYRNHATNIHGEMGADFWATSVDFAAEYVEQTFPLARDPFELAPGEEVTGYIDMRNLGEVTWEPGFTFLGTTEPRDTPSPLAGPDWINDHRAATVASTVPPGGVGRFEFTVRAPMTPGDYPQYFNLVEEGVAWFSDQGGPVDGLLQVRVTVLDVPPIEPDPMMPPGDGGVGEDGGVPDPMTGEPPTEPSEPGLPAHPGDGRVTGGCSATSAAPSSLAWMLAPLLGFAARRRRR
jgi:uncharacterized protein (TIGR03382 family)